MRRTERQQNIEQVATIIGDGYLTREEAEDQNADGWTFEVRYDVEQYVSDSNYTLVEGCVLDDKDLATAWEMAVETEASIKRMLGKV